MSGRRGRAGNVVARVQPTGNKISTGRSSVGGKGRDQRQAGQYHRKIHRWWTPRGEDDARSLFVWEQMVQASQRSWPSSKATLTPCYQDSGPLSPFDALLVKALTGNLYTFFVRAGRRLFALPDLGKKSTYCTGKHVRIQTDCKSIQNRFETDLEPIQTDSNRFRIGLESPPDPLQTRFRV